MKSVPQTHRPQALETSVCSQGGTLTAPVLTECDLTWAANVRQRQLLFTMYVHSSLLGFSGFAPGDVFHGTLIRNLTHAERGDTTAAVRHLFQAALVEPRNERFVLLSDSDVPLYPAKLTWMQLAMVRVVGRGGLRAQPSNLKAQPPGCRSSRLVWTHAQNSTTSIWSATRAQWLSRAACTLGTGASRPCG